MENIQGILDILNKDKEIKDLILKSKFINKDYRTPKIRRGSRSQKTKTGVALDNFWNSLDGINLRCILETKYSLILGTQQIGKVKDALIIYLVKYFEAQQ